MKIATEFKPELIVSTDETRYQLTQVYLDLQDKTDARAVATNGHMLVSCPVKAEAGDSEGYISADALKAARKLAKKYGVCDSEIKANGSLVLGDGATLPRKIDGSFPPFRQVIPSYKAGDEGTITIGLNARYLLDLAKAIGAGELITLTINVAPGEKTTLDPFIVRDNSKNPSDAVGILMPARI